MYARQFELFEPFKDENIACSFHYYPFLHQHTSAKASQKERIVETLFQNVSLQDICSRLKCPIWCGETGALFDQGDQAEQESMLADILEIFGEHEISWSVWAYKDARSMGTLHPKESSEWMIFSKRVKQSWDFWQEFGMRDQSVAQLVEKVPIEIPESLKLKLGFRLLANNQLILTEAYKNIFEEIPFNFLIQYTNSFNFNQCEIWLNVAQIVTKAIKA
jgi:hypothetical protein